MQFQICSSIQDMGQTNAAFLWTTLHKHKSVNCTSMHGNGCPPPCPTKQTLRWENNFHCNSLMQMKSPLSSSAHPLTLELVHGKTNNITCLSVGSLCSLQVLHRAVLLNATRRSFSFIQQGAFLRRPSENDKGKIETESLWCDRAFRLTVIFYPLQAKLIYGRGRRRDALAPGTRRPSTTNRRPARAVFAEVASVGKAPQHAADNVDWKVIAQIVSCQLTNWPYPASFPWFPIIWTLGQDQRSHPYTYHAVGLRAMYGGPGHKKRWLVSMMWTEIDNLSDRK